MLWLTLLAACDDRIVQPPPRGAGSAAPAAPDQLDEKELVETPISAFGLPLPKGFKVNRRTPSNVAAIGPVPLPDVVEYIKSRVDATVDVSGDKTTFEHVKVTNPREPWEGTLKIEVMKRGTATAIEFWGSRKL